MNELFKSPPIEWIQWLVFSQLKIVTFLAGITLALLLYRRFTQKRLAALQDLIGEKIVDEVLMRLESGGEVDQSTKLIRPRKFEFLLRVAMRDLLLEHVQTLSGAERDYLCYRYQELGFVVFDLQNLTSWFWWRRLAAVSHLSVLNQRYLAPSFYKLAGDRNPLVAALALLALSRLRHECNTSALLTTFPSSILDRRNVMLEIVLNWANLYGAGDLLEQLENTRNPQLLSILISALSTLQSPEVAQTFCRILERKFFTYPPETVAQMIQVLTSLGDPASLPVVERYLHHPAEDIRYRAVEMFAALSDERTAATLSSLNGDPSASVQRQLKKWRERRVA